MREQHHNRSNRGKYRCAYKLLETFLFMKILLKQDTKMSEFIFFLIPEVSTDGKNSISKTFYRYKNGTQNFNFACVSIYIVIQ